ncbi:MAG: hypothetical protein GTO02_20955 [Candidatus Dadabacteria bacterium]|nr:hypothetical protein [Candidatus Dadabacteria bacterium]
MKAALLEELNKKKIFTDHICIKDGEITYVDVNVNAFLNKNLKKFESEIRDKITERLEQYFSLQNWEFGKSLREKDLIKNVAVIKEVRQFDVNFITNKSIEDNKISENLVIAKYNEVIRPDNISINFTYDDGSQL